MKTKKLLCFLLLSSIVAFCEENAEKSAEFSEVFVLLAILFFAQIILFAAIFVIAIFVKKIKNNAKIKISFSEHSSDDTNKESSDGASDN